MNHELIHRLGAGEIADRVRTGRLDPVHVTLHFLERIDRLDGELNCFVSVDRDRALSRAGELRRRVEEGSDAGLLAGVPVAVKDNIATSWLPTTCCSLVLEGYRPPYTATAVERVEREGAVVIGKTNMDEFGMGSSNETSSRGPVKNPHDKRRVPGGSSGGSCAAVAAGLVPLALGSDTGGSVRQPAALCGVVGLKPGYGTVSRFGLVAFASSLEQIGTIAGNVPDVALLHSVIRGQDPRDSTSRAENSDALPHHEEKTSPRLRVGIPSEFFPPHLSGPIERACRRAVGILEAEGAAIVPVSLPLTPSALPAYHIIANAEASSNLARYDGVTCGNRPGGARTLDDVYVATRSSGFGREVRRRIMLGTFVLSRGYYEAYYLKAMKVKELITREYEEVFERVDVILTPTTPETAFELGERLDRPVDMYRSDVFVAPMNLAGIPAVSVPVRGVDTTLPVGVQLAGAVGSEELILKTAAMLEGVE